MVRSMASWSKVKQQLESFLCPELIGTVEYRASSYRYVSDKAGQCYMAVNKKEIFSMNDMKFGIRWYQNEQEIIKDPEFRIFISEEEVQTYMEKPEFKNVPVDRIPNIIRKRRVSEVAKKIMESQANLAKSDFFSVANTFLTSSVDSSLNSDDIMLNILAIVDRRIGKNRLKKMKSNIELKHPVVQYFYNLRCGS